MRTKALICAAVFAASVVASMAQVYSLNIVGYYNVPTTNSLNAISVQLIKGANRADEVIPYTVGDNVQVWNNVGWAYFGMDDLSSTGWVDDQGGEVALTSLPTLGLGKGFFYGKQGSVAALTIVGDVLKGTNTITLSNSLNAVGSMLPVAGLIKNADANATISGINIQVPVGDNIQIWNNTGWKYFGNDDLSSTGWVDDQGGESAPPSVDVGQGFFYGKQNADVIWQQWYNF